MKGFQKYSKDGVFIARYSSTRAWYPYGIAVNNSGNIYVIADSFDGYIAKFGKML